MTVLDTVIARILRREGGTFTDLDEDAGGPTRWGVTIPFYTDLTGHPKTRTDIQTLTETQAASLYLTFLESSGLAAIGNVQILDAVADFAVLHGVFPAVKALQKAIGVPVDGIVGPLTRHALSTANPSRTANIITAEQLRRIGARLSSDASQRIFAKGWLNRIADRLEL